MEDQEAPPQPHNMSSSPLESESVVITSPADAENVEFYDSSVFLSSPVEICCPYCRTTIETQVVYRIGTITWLSCVVLCLMGCFAGCCLLPFCTNSLQDADHYCSNCSSHVGTYKPL